MITAAKDMYFKDADVLRWRQNSEKFNPIFLKDIKAGEHQGGRRYFQLFEDYKTQAVLAYLSGDEQGAQINFLKAGNAYLQLLQLPDVDVGYQNFVHYEALLLPLLGNDRKLAEKIASAFGNRAPDAQDHPCLVHTSLSIKFAILNRKAEMQNELTALSRGPILKDMQAIVNLLQVLLKNQKQEIDQAILEMLREFDIECRTQIKGLPESVICVKGLGIIKLYAVLNGTIPIDLPMDTRLPNFFLSNSEKPEFEIDT
ncbi:MAG: hypothetical protein J0L53_08410 [Spirochaetes bacterium]|nr:hypothetical protein [Spirochaetota bacterium]